MILDQANSFLSQQEQNSKRKVKDKFDSIKIELLISKDATKKVKESL